MPIRANLLAEIQYALLPATTPNLTARSQGSDLYEAYIWSIVVMAARAEGAAVEFWNVLGNRVRGNFCFRTAPGHIYSTTHPYSHAVISFPNCPDLEAHTGVYVAGKSGIKHECDVAVLYGDEAFTCRRENVHPRSSQVVLAAECKYFVQSTMGVDLARSFLGLTVEIRQGNRFFVAVSESASVETLFAHHHKNWETGVSPLDVSKRRFERLQRYFERVFRDFKLEYS